MDMPQAATRAPLPDASRKAVRVAVYPLSLGSVGRRPQWVSRNRMARCCYAALCCCAEMPLCCAFRCAFRCAWLLRDHEGAAARSSLLLTEADEHPASGGAPLAQAG